MTKATVCGVPVVVYDFTPLSRNAVNYTGTVINVYYPCYNKQLPTLSNLITLEYTDAEK